MAPKDKKEFEWENGGVIDPAETTPLGDVRGKGVTKLTQALHADPATRKKERDKQIQNTQSKTYRPSHEKKPDDGSIVIEETQSGLSGDIENSAAKKLIDAGQKFKGLDRFGKKK